MSESFFLQAVIRELRDNVGPLLPAGTSKSSLAACQRILLGLCYSKQVAADPDGATIPASLWPAELQAQLQSAAPQSLTVTQTPPENSAFSAATVAVLPGLADWVSTHWAEPGAAPAIEKLIAREAMLHDRAEAFFESFETPAAARTADMSLVLDPVLVENYLRSRPGEDGLRVTGFRQLAGGRSKQTALVSVANNVGLPAQFILRRDHPAATSTRSVALEYPLLEIVHQAGVTVPAPIFLEPDRTKLSGAFVAVGALPGSNHTTHFSVPEFPALAIALAGELARLHAIPFSAWSGIFPEAPEHDSPAARRAQLQDIRANWFKYASSPSITVNAALAWLGDHLGCATGPLCIVHSDVGFHNILTDGPRLVALLDWETAHIGHPAQDLAYCRPVIEQMLPWETFIAAYRAAGGREISEEQIHFFGMWDTLRVDSQLRHARMLYETGLTDDILLAEVGTYYVQRFLHRVSWHLRRATQAGAL